MKLLWSILFGVGNILQTVYGALASSAPFRVGVAPGLGFLLSATLPFLAVAVYVFGRRPAWLWAVAAGLNLLLLLGGFGVVVMGTVKPEQFGPFGRILIPYAVFLTANLLYLLSHQPVREASP